MIKALLDPTVCENARRSRDPRFDGLFFTAVRSTRIYCRPICPAPAPKPENVSYFSDAAAASAAGFRPCLRCRPELSPAAVNGDDDVFAAAIARIGDGALADLSLPQLAGQLGLTDRHLRRLFVARIGVSPLAVHANRRLLFAKQLLTETSLSVTEIALASGFQSIRRFNAAFSYECGMNPTALRRGRHNAVMAGPLRLQMAYRPPYDFERVLRFLAARALPGVEKVDGSSYARVFGTAMQPGRLRLTRLRGGDALSLEIIGAEVTQLRVLVKRVRRLFDLDADPAAIATVLQRDTLLAPLLAKRPGLRVPGAFDSFETAVRAVLGQQVSVAAASTLAARMVQRFGTILTTPIDGFERLFPTPAQLRIAELEQIGLPGRRAQTVRTLAAAVADARIDLETRSDLADWDRRATALPGIGPWTAQYIALRAVHHPDAFPAGDLVVRKALAEGGKPISESQAKQRATGWRPWRAYATLHLWHHLGETK